LGCRICGFAVATFSPPNSFRPAPGEVKGVHYLGGICKYTTLDNQGSFRLFDQQTGLIAQINVTEKDPKRGATKGQAAWNGPLGQGSGTSLGAVDRVGHHDFFATK
jgi:hypothetical protein